MDTQPSDGALLRRWPPSGALGLLAAVPCSLAAAWLPWAATPLLAVLASLAAARSPRLGLRAAPWALGGSALILWWSQTAMPAMWSDGGSWLRSGVGRGALVLAFGGLVFRDGRP